MDSILIDERKSIKGTCKLFMTGAHSFYIDREYAENEMNEEEYHNDSHGTRTICSSSDAAEYEWNKAKKEFCA